MTKKPFPAVAAPLRPRIEKALAEGRSQQALDLANQLFKHEPDPSTRELLKRVTLARAKQLRGEGKARDAVVVLQAKLALDTKPEWRAAVAEELATCGAIQPALEAISGLEDQASRTCILARVADAAIEVGPAARAQLSPDLQTGFDLVLRASHFHAEGKDDEAREALQGIGLQSPFLEWKLLLRGLMAYQAQEDARACENWQRLNAERLPARLAAPLRLGIDPAFAAAQPAATQQALRRAADRLAGNPQIVPLLRTAQAMLAQPERLPDAFNLASSLVPAVRQAFPDLLPRVVSCYYWAVVHGNEERNLKRFAQIFGVPASDPDTERLSAMLWDDRGHAEFAHKHWHAYEQAIARQPESWSGGHAARMRALVLEYMAEIAGACEPPPGMSDFDDGPRLKPDAEACLKQSIELAPDRRHPYLELLDRYEAEGKASASKADKLAQSMLERFPDEASVWESLGDRAISRGSFEKAADYFAEASKRSPLDGHIRAKTTEAYVRLARKRAKGGKIEPARASFAEALALAAPDARGRILGLWAAAEHASNEMARVQELREQAGADAASRLPARYVWLVEVIRRKLGRTLKAEADRDFAAALAEATAPAAVVGALCAAASEGLEGKYTAQAGHQKKIIALLKASDPGAFSEIQLERICESLQSLGAYLPLRTWALAGQKRFPQNPFLVMAEASCYLAPKGRQSQPWAAIEPLKRARSLAEATPDGSARRRLFAFINPLLERLKPRGFNAGPLAAIMERVFGGIDMDDFADDPW